MREFTVADAAKAVGLPQSHIRGWLQRAALETVRLPGGNHRIRFDRRGLRILALMKAQTERGISPNLAAQHAASIVDRDTRGWPIAAVFSGEAQRCPAVVPEDAFPSDGPLLIVPLQPLYRAIDEAIGAV
jgi:hypothetical protein